MVTGKQVTQGYQRIKDKTTGDETLVFKYMIDEETSQTVKYKIIYPLGGKISGSFLSAIKSTMGDAIEFVSEDGSGHRLTETLSKENINAVVKELYAFLEEHYLFNALSRNQLSKTVCKESIIIAVPYSEKVVFIYRGHRSENDVEANLMLHDGLAFYGVYCSNVFYFQSQDEIAEFTKMDYPVALLTFDDLEAKIISEIKIKLKKTIKGSETNLPCRKLSDGMQKKLSEEYSHIAQSYFIDGKMPDPDHYLTLFPSEDTLLRLSFTSNICSYLANPEGFAKREAERHIIEYWEPILYSILLHRQVSCEIARLKGAQGFLESMKN